MNLGNKLAVGEAVDPGFDLEADPAVGATPEPESARPVPAAPAAVAVVTPEEPVPAHAEH